MTPNEANVAHDDLQELLGAYALDALLPDERAALRAHLTRCPECRAELVNLRVAVANLPLLLDEIEPPAALRGRLEVDLRADLAARSATPSWGWGAMSPDPPPAFPPPLPLPAAEPSAARTTPEIRPLPGQPTPIRPVPSTRAVLPWAAAALLFAVSVGMLLWNLRLQDEAGRPEERTVASACLGALGRTTSLEARRLEGVVVALVPGDTAREAGGEVLLDREDDLLVLDVRDLPPLAAGEVYQVWLIGDEGAPVPSGVFAAPTARHAIAADPAAYQTLAITNEPGPLGSPGPTGEIVATAPLGG